MLNLDILRAANKARLPQYKNRRGEPAHSEPDGSDWLFSAWSNATSGEIGELSEAILFMMLVKASGKAADHIKKIERGDKTLEQARAEVAKELADVLTYLDLLAAQLDINLGEATIKKFNEISERVGSSIFINEDGQTAYDFTEEGVVIIKG